MHPPTVLPSQPRVQGRARPRLLTAAASAAAVPAIAAPTVNDFALRSTTTTYNTLFDASTVPGVASESDSASVELGVVFKSDVAGQILGVRYYKSGANTGTHVGSLWDGYGRRLAGASFVNETLRGWQTVMFSTPVSVAAGTKYVASYHAPVGHYADDQGVFGHIDKAPLHAYAGVYKYGTSVGYPTSTWNGSNYYVDVLFVPSDAPTPVPTVSPTVSPTV